MNKAIELGLAKPEMLTLWEKVKANHRRLTECVGPHDFVEAGYFTTSKGKTTMYRCLKCDGSVDDIAHNWYTLGLKHGGRG